MLTMPFETRTSARRPRDVGADVFPFLLFAFEPRDVIRVELGGSDADLPVVHQHGCWIRPACGPHCRFEAGTLAVDGGRCQQPDSKVGHLPLLYPPQIPG